MLEARGLRCVRDGRMLFDALDLGLQPGDILQVEGANGAGKTSLLRLLCGLAEPQAGNVCWQGSDIRACRPAFYHELLYLGHRPGIKEELTALENLRFFQTLGSHVDAETSPDEALDRVGLYGYEDVEVRMLSAGQRRRVALARLWLSRAALWVLDEPFTAIDRDGIRDLEECLAQQATRGGMVILTTHQTLHLDASRVHHLRLG